MEVPFHFHGFLARSQENSKCFFTIAGYLPGLIMLIGRCLIQSSTSQVDSNGVRMGNGHQGLSFPTQGD